MPRFVKRLVPLLALIAGAVALWLVLPLYTPAQPQGAAVTRPDARATANRAAEEVGIPVERSWTTLIWYPSQILDKALREHPQREAAWLDPVLGPRLNAYRLTYYHLDKDKFPPQGYVHVSGRSGEVTGARSRLRAEDAGAKATEDQLRPVADAFVKSRTFPGAPAPRFESARPTVLRGRTDWVFRYRVPMEFPLENIVPYLTVHFNGDELAGWDLTEEYADARQFRGDDFGDVAGLLLKYAAMLIMLLILLVIFLRKYHAGEVGVSAGTFLFAVMLVMSVASSLLTRVSASEGVGMGFMDARMVSWVLLAFRTLFADIPTAVLLFLAWAVGESYARERWGERLAGFDAILRRDALNATVGRSMLFGLLFAPAIAAAALGVGAIPTATGHAWPSWSRGTLEILFAGGPAYALLAAATQALLVSIAAILFILAWTHRHRVLWIGVLVAILLGAIAGATAPPIEPVSMQLLFGFGGIAAAVAVFLAYDLLAATTAMFGAAALTSFLPLLSVARGNLLQELGISLALPFVLIIGFAAAALATRREIAYTADDLAPHVKRIIERERVKAEIDAANRIQSALLPVEAPQLAGATVASHYRAATEIGGDYFDFLDRPGGEIGIAFGDVSGHGLTSGIVMAMAKSALLVQVENDASPRVVLEILNDIVIRTAPKRILMTFFFGLLDTASQTLRFASAGHLDPYVYRARTKKLEALSSWGFPLGIRRREPFREHSVDFAPGDRLVLYSDGLIEAVDDDGEPFGFDRFEQTIAANGGLTAEDLKKSILAAVRKFTRNRPPEDDQTLVVVAFESSSRRVVESTNHAIATA